MLRSLMRVIGLDREKVSLSRLPMPEAAYHAVRRILNALASDGKYFACVKTTKSLSGNRDQLGRGSGTTMDPHFSGLRCALPRPERPHWLSNISRNPVLARISSCLAVKRRQLRAQFCCEQFHVLPPVGFG